MYRERVLILRIGEENLDGLREIPLILTKMAKAHCGEIFK